MTFELQRERLDGRVEKIRIALGRAPLTVTDAINCWRRDEDFRSFFTGALCAAPFAAYFWELPPMTTATLDAAFEFVLVDSPELAGVSADRRAFAEHFTGETPVVEFGNLGGDAWLVAPCPGPDGEDYPHLAAFARGAPMAQQHALWHTVGTALRERISARPLWLSTSGLGIYWLHLRIDTRPKYYTHAPYRRAY